MPNSLGSEYRQVQDYVLAQVQAHQTENTEGEEAEATREHPGPRESHELETKKLRYQPQD